MNIRLMLWMAKSHKNRKVFVETMRSSLPAEPQKDWQWPKSIFCENRDDCFTIKQILEQGWSDYLIADAIRDTCEKCGEITVE